MTSRLPHRTPFGNTGATYNMFFFSLLLHLVALAAVITSVPGVSRQMTLGAPYAVSLVGSEVLQTPDKEATSAKSLLPELSPEQPTILKQETGIIKSAAIAEKVESTKADIEKAISAIRQKDLLAPEEQKKSQTLPAVPGASSPNSAQINDYSRFIWSKIKKNWTIPAALLPKNNMEAIIEVRIGQSGALEYVGFEKHSGNRYFDESAMRAVKKSAPFPPLAGWVADRSIEIGIRFHSAELR